MLTIHLSHIEFHIGNSEIMAKSFDTVMNFSDVSYTLNDWTSYLILAEEENTRFYVNDKLVTVLHQTTDSSFLHSKLKLLT
eukprot:UN13099